VDEYVVSHCFREAKPFSELDKKAINVCYGRILDIGAGVRPHSFKLQNLGYEVYAIDVSPQACDIMKRIGVKKVTCSTIYHLEDEGFDTILLLGRAIGFAEDLKGMSKFLNRCRAIMNVGGIILLDSVDIHLTTNPEYLAYHERNRKLGRYIGVIGLQTEFKGKLGKSFKLLHIDPDMLKMCTLKNDFNCEILYQDINGNYLAKLSLNNPIK
jgi:SAM-dependent methyltransferase